MIVLETVASARTAIEMSKLRTCLERVLPFLIVLLSLLAPICGWAQSSRRFSSISLALEGIRQTFFVPTGFENATGDLDKTPVTLDLSSNDVSRVLDALVAQRPSYVWSLRDGFYDVYPKLKFDSFAQLTVANYAVKEVTLIEAVHAIDKLPEVQKWLERRHATRADLIGGSRLMTPGVPFQPQRMSFAFKNLPVRSILNGLYRNFGQTQWTVWHEGQHISMFFSP
jgi:hypothetical protein